MHRSWPVYLTGKWHVTDQKSARSKWSWPVLDSLSLAWAPRWLLQLTVPWLGSEDLCRLNKYWYFCDSWPMKTITKTRITNRILSQASRIFTEFWRILDVFTKCRSISLLMKGRSFLTYNRSADERPELSDVQIEYFGKRQGCSLPFLSSEFCVHGKTVSRTWRAVAPPHISRIKPLKSPCFLLQKYCLCERPLLSATEILPTNSKRLLILTFGKKQDTTGHSLRFYPHGSRFVDWKFERFCVYVHGWLQCRESRAIAPPPVFWWP